MLTTLLLTAFLQAATPAPTPGPSAPNHHLVHVHVRDAATLDKVLALGLDLASCYALELPVKVLEVIADDHEVERIRRAGLDFEIVIRNLEDTIEAELSKYVFPDVLTPPVGQGGMGGHYTFAQIVGHLDNFVRANPSIVSTKVSLGKSHEGRDIWVVKISDNVNVDENEPEVLYDALHHAREPLSATATLQFMDWLIDNYTKDPLAKFLVDNREMYFVPCLNPDGYEYNRSIRSGGGGMWRKNRRNNGGSFGVDLNRNWTTGWNAPFGGNSTNPTSDIYRGPSPFSEPETRALENFIKSRKFVLGTSTHTYTEVLLRPWGYQRGDPPNVAEYRKIEDASLERNPMRRGAASTELYIAAGTALDHYHAAHGMYGFTPELGLSSEGGFWPNPTNQVRISDRHQYMLQQFALLAGSAIKIDSAVLSEAPGGNNNGKVDPGEIGELRVVLDNNGASATLTPVNSTLKSLTNGVVPVRQNHSFGTIAKFSSANNNSAPLTLKVDKNFQGLSAKVELSISYEGQTIQRQIDLPFATAAPIVGTDFEKDLGFRRSTSDTATTGRFERAAPQQTSSGGRIYQPGADHTPNGTQCWVTGASAGSSVGSNDVDSGQTEFLSPIVDLRHVALPKLSFWLYYSESVRPGDPFTVEMSSNGGSSWSEIYRRTTSTPAWEQVEIELQGAMTDQMQFRFHAQDVVSQSLVEACVDDLELQGIVESASTTLLGGAQIGSAVRFALRGEANGFGLLMLSAGTASINLPGIGTLRLDPNNLFVGATFAYGSQNEVGFDLDVANDASLRGLRIHWQQLFFKGASLKLGNETSFHVK